MGLTVFIVQHIYPMPDNFREPSLHTDRAAAEQACGKGTWIPVAANEWFVFHRHEEGAIVYHVKERRCWSAT
jgi:hypothetical protein